MMPTCWAWARLQRDAAGDGELDHFRVVGDAQGVTDSLGSQDLDGVADLGRRAALAGVDGPAETQGCGTRVCICVVSQPVAVVGEGTAREIYAHHVQPRSREVHQLVVKICG